MKIEKRTKKIAVIALAGALVVGGGGAAFAWWSSQGTGVGEATTGVSEAFTVTNNGTTGPALYPGGPAQTLAFAVNNPGPADHTLSNVTVTVAEADGTAWTAITGCSAADYTIGTPVITYGPIVAGESATGTATITMINSATDQDACQGVDVPLYIVAA